MVKIIRGDDWCEVIDNDKLIFEGHTLEDALEAYLDYYAIEYQKEWSEEDD